MTDALPEVMRSLGAPVDPAEMLGADGYAPGEVVGIGRRGPTVRARRLGDGRLVALKVGRPLGSARARRSFIDQAAVLERLPALPHVAPVVGAGLSPGGWPWLATPWYDGTSIAERLRHGPLPIPEAVEAARSAVAALAGLHQAGLLHANLTPASMLRDAHGEVWIDGVTLPTLAPAAEVSGSGPALADLPPEILEGAPWSAPGDVWALGSCLHTMLVGQQPWAPVAGRGSVALLLAMATGESPGLARPDSPSWLAALVVACLAVHEAERPSAQAVLASIERENPSPLDTFAPRSAGEDNGRPLGSSYLLVEPLGSGASGQVWRGRRRWDGGAVAVKVLRPELGGDPDTVARFLRERAALIGLEHPNLVRIFDLVAEGETLAIVMDLVEGPNLRRLLTSRGPPPPAEACKLLSQVASGIAFVHAAGIVHRDLKPENVLVEWAGTPSARARLTDFGIARALSGPTITRADQLLGTAAYLAPELVAGRPLTPAVDVYSLGVLTYESLTGRRPFEAEHPGAILRAHLEVEPTRPEGMSDAIWDVVSRCLAKDPEARPDAAAAALELARLAGGPGAAALTLPSRPPAPLAPLSAPPLPPFAPPVPPASGPPAGRPASEEMLTEMASRPLPQAPEPDTLAGHPKRWSTRARVAVLAAVALVAAGVGVAVTLAQHGPTVQRTVTAPLTVKVTVTGVGAVSVTWANEETHPDFLQYVSTQDGRPTQPQPTLGATGLTLDLVPAGVHCYAVGAVFTGPLPAGLGGKAPPPNCVTVR